VAARELRHLQLWQDHQLQEHGQELAGQVQAARPSNQWKFQIKLKRLTLPGPFQGPVSAMISYGASINRQDQIMDCHATSSGLSCREF